MGGFWELPGGKIENGESAEQAIIREFNEELGVRVKHLSLHQTIVHHHYEDRIVELRIYNINQYQNTPAGLEDQAIAWVKITDLNNYQLLATMKALINSIRLPNKYWITPSNNHHSDGWMKKFNQKLTQNIELIQLRSKIKLSSIFITELHNKCKKNNIKLLLNIVNKTFEESYCNGWHLTTDEMLSFTKRPCTNNKLLGASTHNLTEALKAQEMGADFIVISPVQATQTHLGSLPLGWDTAINVVDKVNIPVYFLGGMGVKDLDKTLQLGAQGIAGVSAF